MKILAVDPGCTDSAYALLEMPSFKLYEYDKLPNVDLLAHIETLATGADEIAVEMIASYGMPVGKEVFDTCVWIGRFAERIGRTVYMVYRMEEKVALCHNSRATDANIRRALIDRYAAFDFKAGKGTKKHPDVFHGVKADIWQAIAVGVTHYEKKQGGKK